VKWRSYFILSTCLLLSLCKSSAQYSVSSFKRFGFQIGINLTNMNFNAGEPPPALHANPSWQTGFTIGFQLKVPLATKWILQPEYSFCERNGSDQTIQATYVIDYFSLPILLNYQLSPRFNLLAGPQFEITTDASSTVNGDKNNITHDVEERGIGVVCGLEFTVIKSLFISPRYFQGLNHVGIGQRSDTKEFKYQSFMLTAGIRF
jgi:Outer membrane protein beta-barrel domain